MPIAIFNSPNFQVLDVVYGGFHMNSHFFSVKIEPAQTIYKVYKNNVRSHGAIRQGSLVIGMSIPRGYKLAGTDTPYDVLMKLMNTFMALCMTCKDQTTKTYEYNSEYINTDVLNEVAKQFQLIPHKGPHRPMRMDSQNIGYITADEAKIRQFMADVQYPAFTNFGEVLVAAASSATNYTHLSNIEIPRVREYRIIDGLKNSTAVRDINAQITGRGSKDERYYKNLTVTFSIAALLRGENVANVQLDPENETVTIDANNLSIPLERNIRVVTSPSSIKAQDIEIATAIGRLNLNANSSFTLRGEQLEILSNPLSIKPSYVGGGSYIITNASLRNDEYIITLEQRVPTPVAAGAATPSATNAREIKISLGENSFAGNKKIVLNDGMKFSYRIYTNNSENELSKLRGEDRLIKNHTTGRYECSLFVPKSWPRDLFVNVTVNKLSLETRVKAVVGNDLVVAKEFEPSMRRNSKADTIIVRHLVMFILGILLGLGAGYLLFAHSKPTQQQQQKTEQTTPNTNKPANSENPAKPKCEYCGKEYNTPAELEQHKNNTHKCNVCKKYFKDVNKHKKERHPELIKKQEPKKKSTSGANSSGSSNNSNSGSANSDKKTEQPNQPATSNQEDVAVGNER